jgi:hypothetical protein
VPEANDEIKTLVEGTPYVTRANAGDFESNHWLGLQLCGDGRQDGNIITGMLKLNVNRMQRRWTEVQELLGQAIIKVGEEVLDEHLHIECQLSPVGTGGRHALLDVASDTGWDKRGSSRLYDSINCTKGTDHDASVYPKNYEGSSKGMEATGAVRIVRKLFQNLKHTLLTW